ncbi:S26 family signal peptidase [Spirillospora sp. CA-255316]
MLRAPRGGGFLIKRVAALPGDPLPASVTGLVAGGGTVSDRHLVLLGDNAEVSYDSRRHGCFPDSLLHGVVIRRLRPSPRKGGRPHHHHDRPPHERTNR